MVIALAAAALLLSPAPIPVAIVTVLAIAAPAPALVGILGWAAWSAWSGSRRRSSGNSEAGYLGALAAELRSGHGLRASLVAAAGRSPDLDMRTACRLATAGQPIERVASALQAGLPSQGEAAAGAVRIASLTGGRTAAVFESLAVLAREETELAGERAAAAAQARLSAVIVAGIPVAILAVAGLSGRLGELVSGGPAGMVMVALGIGLLAIGSAWVIGLLRRRAG